MRSRPGQYDTSKGMMPSCASRAMTVGHSHDTPGAAASARSQMLNLMKHS